MISEHFIMPYIFGSLMAEVTRIVGDPRAVDSAAVMARSIELSELMAAIFNKEKDVEILDRFDREIYDQIVRLYKSKYTSRKKTVETQTAPTKKTITPLNQLVTEYRHSEIYQYLERLLTAEKSKGLLALGGLMDQYSVNVDIGFPEIFQYFEKVTDRLAVKHSEHFMLFPMGAVNREMNYFSSVLLIRFNETGKSIDFFPIVLTSSNEDVGEERAMASLDEEFGMSVIRQIRKIISPFSDLRHYPINLIGFHVLPPDFNYAEGEETYAKIADEWITAMNFN